MTDSIPTWNVEEIFPDGADPVDAALAQLREPHHLLAEALAHTRAAQVIGRDLQTSPERFDDDAPPDTRHEQHRRLLDEAFQLSQIAKIAVEMAAAEREGTMHPVPTVEETVDDDVPRPVQATFRAAIFGIPMGRCGGRSWVWTELYGFIDVTDGVEFDPGEPGVGYMLSGRVAAMTGRHVLGVQGSGTAICLPRALAGLEPDE